MTDTIKQALSYRNLILGKYLKYLPLTSLDKKIIRRYKIFKELAVDTINERR